ncbi:hypothetical protein ASPWEDRAFT_46424 [Aspergillus wentii DTO 134E9]|uniref:Nucleotide-diphospho-sugar transferase n=1 Tax=Aspergillus wentii DTO 134E9 TaxID=1073089 RepID=A0A1L9R434_ASPWE|nr:uncharacterized protein ASPWEDRAFT_46424 [Aspergillus wentii DTO 134E9]KAI9926962.1 hypothetical protein MW887_003342 [Aspergillus wentii]OJJ29678.1 hypothetical protein ASPWEDRAFT_46424 [Aspergillus wentii DTO 134E9]
MNSTSSRLCTPRRLIGSLLLLVALGIFALLVPARKLDNVPFIPFSLQRTKSYNESIAITTLLAHAYDEEDSDEDNEDVYFIGARILAYQLLHAPETKSRRHVPFIVLVTPDVRKSKRDRLKKDGAQIVEVESVHQNVSITVPRWADTFTKLRVLDPKAVPYERALYLDTDIILTRPIDAIFDDPNAWPVPSVKDSASPLGQGEAFPPDSLLMAATPETKQQDHPYPFVDEQHEKTEFNSGFFVYSPSSDMLEYYLTLLEYTDRYFHGLPDQDLFNYAHRLDGPMPWKTLQPSWNINWSNDEDLKGGIASLHVKFWDFEYFSQKTREYAVARRWEMEGYWKGRNKS